MFGQLDKRTMVSPDAALPGRSAAIKVAAEHYVNGHTMLGDDGAIAMPAGYQKALFGLGCFWGAERKFWQRDGVYLTAVGYAAGYTPNPNYEEVCSGATGHNEVVIVVFDPERVTYNDLLKVFWESHNPTQGMQQGNDRGTQYRSGIYTYDEQQFNAATSSMQQFQNALKTTGYGDITTEILSAPHFYFAEVYHQQYLAKNPNGYCGLGGTGVCLPD